MNSTLGHVGWLAASFVAEWVCSRRMPGDWQYAAFAGLIESEETLATQHGLERWEP